MAGSEVMAVVLPFISWFTLPQMITKVLLRGLYDCQVIARPVNPAQAQLHVRRMQTLVILGYLSYTVFSTVFQRSPNYYELLGLPLSCESEDVRKAFRRLARIYHPDKAGGREKDELFFIELRRAHDCLSDPAKRIAYDRFGTSVLNKQELTTEREFSATGLQNSLAFYIIHPISYGFVNWVAGRKVITFWLFTMYIILLSCEVSLIFQGARHTTFAFLPSTMTAHDVVTSLHSAYTAFILASTHLGPLLPTLRDANASANTAFNHLFDGATSEKDLAGLRDLVGQQEARSVDLQVQSGRNIDMTLLPLRPMAKASVPTIRHAANEAAKRRAHPTQSMSTAPAVDRQPSRLEEAFIYRLGQSILRHRLEVIPAVREALKRRSGGNGTTEKKQTAKEKSESLEVKGESDKSRAEIVAAKVAAVTDTDAPAVAAPSKTQEQIDTITNTT